MPTWLINLLSAGAGAFFAALAGAQLGFRRTKKERALDRRIAWHEETIQTLARYEEKLERLHKHSRHVLIAHRTPPAASTAGAADLPRNFRVPSVLWAELADVEMRARAALRLADLYTDLDTQVACSTALSNTVNVVSAQWLDISPEPEIPWADLSSRAVSVGSLRGRIQESHIKTLELAGFWAAVFPWYRQWKLVRSIRKLQARLAKAAS